MNAASGQKVNSQQALVDNIPLALYIHFPWCIRKCPYCDFNSHLALAQGNLPQQAYIETLLKDLDAALPLIGKRPLLSIFMGGGTPSLIDPALMAKLLQEIKRRIAFNDNMEVTMEANPGTLEQARFTGFKDAGINRLSLGLQSLQDDKLKALGRIHDSQTAINAVQCAQQAGFDNINVDLMFGLPQQTEQDALSDLTQAIALQPAHLSWYQLTIEPGTHFFYNRPPLPTDESIWATQEKGQAQLKKAGFSHYEVSAYYHKAPCQHNLNYWRFGDYLGIGAGAHGKITLKNGKILRQQKHRHPNKYLSADNCLKEQVEISQQDLPFEFMLNALRLNHAISFDLFEQRTGLSKQQIEEPLNKALDKQLITLDAHRFCPTSLGRRFLNDLVNLFLPTS